MGGVTTTKQGTGHGWIFKSVFFAESYTTTEFYKLDCLFSYKVVMRVKERFLGAL